MDLCRGLAVVCDCGTLWTFLLTFCLTCKDKKTYMGLYHTKAPIKAVAPSSFSVNVSTSVSSCIRSTVAMEICGSRSRIIYKNPQIGTLETIIVSSFKNTQQG